MINIKRLSVAFLIGVLFFSENVFAQKINKTDVNGKRTGVWRKYYSNNRIRYEGQFKNGKEYGTFKFYDITTSKHPVVIKKYEANSNKAFVQFFTLKGKLRSKGVMIGKKRIGKWIYYFPTGKLFSEEIYKDGKLEGVLKNYYANGKLTEETLYKNGLKNGTSKKFTDEGVLIEEIKYVNGKREGLAKYYDLKGGLKEKGIFKADKRFGKWEFYLDGEIVEKNKNKSVKKN